MEGEGRAGGARREAGDVHRSSCRHVRRGRPSADVVGACGGAETKDRQPDAHLSLADQHQWRQRAEAACVDRGCGDRDSQVLHGSEGVRREDDGAGRT